MQHFLFGVYPYIAIAVMIVGSIVRYERDPFTWKTGSSQLLRRRQFIWGSVLFHVGVLFILAGHIVGLLTPVVVWDTLGVSHEAKQILAMTSGGLAGLMALAGGIILLQRRLSDPRIRANSTIADTGILLLLVVQLILGIGTVVVSFQHLDGSEMMRFMHWAQAVVYFGADPAGYLAGASWLIKTHVVLGLTIFLLFPFSRLVHMISAPLRFFWRPGWQIVRSRKGARPSPRSLPPLPADPALRDAADRARAARDLAIQHPAE
ncbi:MAG: respiratory nitrate reductase subunit gamma [Rubellimicrobium sp.]|nr:respiratory nitrate reductase subunit gamma [Rubellimicrobium sp.]